VRPPRRRAILRAVAVTIEEVYEPYLLQEGFIARTAKGRIATARAYNHFGRHKQGTLL